MKRNWKRINALFLAICLLFVSSFALAEGNPGNPPDGQPPQGQGGTPPEKPDGEAPGEPPAGDMGGGPGGMGGPGGSSQPDSYAAVQTVSEDTQLSGVTLDSMAADENALLVTAGNVQATDSTLTRNSTDSTGGDSARLYGVGAAALVTGGTLEIRNSTITTDANGGAGVFAYGSGVATVADTTIDTTQDTSGGIHVAGGGTLYASNLTVITRGNSSAAIRSDRGGGTMVVDGGTLTGAFVDDESNAGTGGSGYASLTVEGDSAWVVTGNSVLTDPANVSQIVDSQGRTVTIQSADGTIYVQGTSDVTVTLNSYTTQIDTTGTSTADSWSSYAAA